jgi:hypothetical protein
VGIDREKRQIKCHTHEQGWTDSLVCLAGEEIGRQEYKERRLEKKR